MRGYTAYVCRLQPELQPDAGVGGGYGLPLTLVRPTRL